MIKVRCRQVSILVLVLILCSAFVAADAPASASTEITVTSIKNQINLGDEATFGLKIVNTGTQVLRYSIYSLQNGQGWNVNPSPLRDRIIELRPGQAHTTTIVAEPLEDFVPGIYHVQITIENDLGERFARNLKIYLAPETPLDYVPNIEVTVDMDEKINPQAAVPIKIFLENRNPLDLAGLKVRIQSDIPEFVQEATVDLPPLEKKTVEFSIIPNPYQQPKEYTLFFVFQRDDQTIHVVEKRVEILPRVPAFSVTVDQEKIYLKHFYTVTITNEGNVLNTQEVHVPLSLWQALFSTTAGGHIVLENGARALVWEVTLNPNESTTFYFTTNYRLLVYLLAIVAFFTGFYFYVQSPIVVTKSAVTTKANEEGALSEIKVTLELRNRSSKPMKEIHVIDKVPGIANIEKSLELGTLKPEEIKHGKQGTKVIWSLAELEGQEHRLITYKVKAKLNILGTFSLPRAVVEFKRGSGRKGKAYSNVYRIES